MSYLCMPFADVEIPGTVMERVIELSNPGSKILKTYDFVDVCSRGDKGWQVKATKIITPITWKRAKIPNKNQLIKDSQASKEGCQLLGDAIVDFCNASAHTSFKEYSLKEIYYSRLIVDSKAKEWRYFERLIATKESPDIFDKTDLTWAWNEKRSNTKKELLPAFVGRSKSMDIKYFAWHGMGENQLHFTGENCWHPTEEEHMIRIKYESFRRLNASDLYNMAISD